MAKPDKAAGRRAMVRAMKPELPALAPVCCLDLGTLTGVAVLGNAPGTHEAGAMHIHHASEWRLANPKKTELPGFVFGEFWQRLEDVRSEYGVQRLNNSAWLVFCYEDVLRWSSSAAAKRYCGLLATLQTFCVDAGLPEPIGVPIREVKECLTGVGNANKEAMIEHAMGIWTKLVQDPTDPHSDNVPEHELTDNIADALAIAHWWATI